uniref:Uncharacterized protein n=1 Tax=Glossina austeni TaxID=7395 RepID=A0A1A9V429_GLOAU
MTKYFHRVKNPLKISSTHNKRKRKKVVVECNKWYKTESNRPLLPYNVLSGTTYKATYRPEGGVFQIVIKRTGRSYILEISLSRQRHSATVSSILVYQQTKILLLYVVVIPVMIHHKQGGTNEIKILD